MLIKVGDHYNNFRLLKRSWACTPLSGTAPIYYACRVYILWATKIPKFNIAKSLHDRNGHSSSVKKIYFLCVLLLLGLKINSKSCHILIHSFRRLRHELGAIGLYFSIYSVFLWGFYDASFAYALFYKDRWRKASPLFLAADASSSPFGVGLPFCGHFLEPTKPLVAFSVKSSDSVVEFS